MAQMRAVVAERPDEDPGELSARLLAEIRALVPPSISYRKRAGS